MEKPRSDVVPSPHLDIVAAPELLREFFPLFQQGVAVGVRVGCTLALLLRDEFGLDEAYVEQRITTIFLDSKPIDDVHRAIVRDGSTIALSGAMPGLVGATMRRGGYYAPMRGAISLREGANPGIQGYGTVRVKLFNLLLPELAPVLLRRGVILPVSDLTELFREKNETFRQGCRARLDGAPIAPEALKSGEAFSCGTVRLRVDFSGQGLETAVSPPPPARGDVDG
jgi:hypothetical protein